MVIEPSGLMGGSERALLDLLTHVDPLRFEMIVACPPATPFAGELKHLGIRTIEAPLAYLHLRGLLARLEAVWSITRALRRVKPDVVHVNQAGLLRIVSAACLIVGTPVICHVRLLEDSRALRTRPPAVLRPAMYVAVSNAVLSALGPHGSEGSVPRRLVYDPLDEKLITAQANGNTRPNVRAELAIPADAKVLALIGRICEDKRQRLFVEVAGELKCPDYYYLIVGNEPIGHAENLSLTDSLKERIAALGLERRVLFTGFRNDIPSVMRSCDAIVLASEEEALGRVLLEGLALGKPIIGPAGAGPGEIIGDNERGLGFAPGSASLFASAIRETFADTTASAIRTNRGIAWVREHCSPRDHARQMEALYESNSRNGRARLAREN